MECPPRRSTVAINMLMNGQLFSPKAVVGEWETSIRHMLSDGGDSIAEAHTQRCSSLPGDAA